MESLPRNKIKEIKDILQNYLENTVVNYGWIVTRGILRKELEKKLNHFLPYVDINDYDYQSYVEETPLNWLEQVFRRDPNLLCYDVVIQRRGYEKTIINLRFKK